jgi:hypothetical protein
MSKERVFVFRETERRANDNQRQRTLMYAFCESKITSIESQWGSQNCYLVVNGIEVQGSFDELVELLGQRVNMK